MACMSWWGLDAEGIARLDQENRVSIVGHIIPSVAYHEGDPQFWCAKLKIDWEDNGARQQATGGARALGIKVSREHLVALLPEEPRERVEELGQTKPAEPKSLERKAGPTPESPQSKRAERYIKKNFPRGTDGIPTAVICRKLAKDKDLQAELEKEDDPGGVPSAAVINRVLGRRQK